MLESQAMASTLRHITENCHGDDRPDPIIQDLASCESHTTLPRHGTGCTVWRPAID